MLTLCGGTHRLCDGVSRRDFLHIGGLGVGCWGLSDLLRSQAAAQEPKRAHKSLIIICLRGGPSHIDLYDLKPDAPAEFRGELRPIRTNVAGMDISELLPLQAKMADKFAIVRSLRYRSLPPGDHHTHEMFTGFPSEERRPPLGSIVSRFRKGVPGGLPPYVSLGGHNPNVARLRHPEDPQYLGIGHGAFATAGENDSTGRQLDNLRLRPGMTMDRLQDRASLLQAFDSLRRELDTRADLTGGDAFTRRALEMITSPAVYNAFDLSQEPDQVRARYGPDCPAPPVLNQAAWLASKFLLARRLVEAGVPVVTLAAGEWDHHGVLSNGPRAGIYERLREEAPRFDRAFHALITDLEERGLLDNVVVLAWGEMGRTPRINHQAGRDHWQEVGFALLAGGGLKTGQVIGSTDRLGQQPHTNLVTPQNVLATIYPLLGIDPALTIPNLTGRPMYVLDDREPIAALQ